MPPDYAFYHGQRVQVLERFTARQECCYCGNQMLDGGGSSCPACGGTSHEGYERVPVEWVKIGLSSGPHAGATETIRAGALTTAEEQNAAAIDAAAHDEYDEGVYIRERHPYNPLGEMDLLP